MNGMGPAIDISDIDRAELVAALHNNTAALGLGRLHDVGHCDAANIRETYPMVCDEKQDPQKVDYVHGRPIKVYLSGASLYRADLYDRDVPPGRKTCAEVVATLGKKL